MIKFLKEDLHGETYEDKHLLVKSLKEKLDEVALK